MASSASANLEDVPSVDLMTELLRRMKCSTKPDKRLILVGNIFFQCFKHFHLNFVLQSLGLVNLLRSDVIWSTEELCVRTSYVSKCCIYANFLNLGLFWI